MTTSSQPRDAEQLAFMSATALQGVLRSREVSSVEITRALLDRIEQVNPRLNAFTVVLKDEALTAAREADRALASDRQVGPLHGIPFTLKDLTWTAGIRTMRGSKAFADEVPAQNAVLFDRLLGAGGILLGKTTTPELGNKGVTESPLTGTTNNPWKTTHIAGGSSGGAAAAVAAGLCPLAEGSDGGGSIRIPAAACGVVGFKPSYGRVPSYPSSGGFSALTHQGPITRTVADAALMLSVIAGPSDHDAYSIDESGVDYVAAIREPSVRGLRIAYSRDLGLGAPDPRVAVTTDAAARLFADVLGAVVEEATVDMADAEAIMMTVWSTQLGYGARAQLLSRISRAEVDPAIIALLERSEKLSPYDYYEAAFIRRGEFYQRTLRFFQDYDLLITPTLLTPPFPHPGWQPGPGEIAGRPINPLLGWFLTYPFNLTGQPAISIPCGFTADGLPIGLQIVGRRRADTTVLRAAAAYEQAAPWSDRRPPLD